MKKHFPWIFTIAAFAVEWFFLNHLMVLNKAGTLTTCYASLVLIIPLGLWFVVGTRYLVTRSIEKRQNGKASNVPLLLPFIRTVKAEVVTANGVVSVLFILFNLAWTQDLLLDWIRGDGPWLYPAFTFICFVVPFVWPPVSKGKKQIVPVDKRKVLISGLSSNGGAKEKIKVSDPKNGGYTGWMLNWEPIHACIEHYPNLERVLIINSPQTSVLPPVVTDLMTEEFNQGLPPEQHIVIDSFRKLFSHSVTRNIDLIEKELANVNDYNQLFPELRRVINGFLAEYGYKDEDVLFSVTGSTAVMSAGLTFLSMPGQRGCVYSSQEPKSAEGTDLTPVQKLTEFEVDIYTVDELWQEIIEKAHGE